MRHQDLNAVLISEAKTGLINARLSGIAASNADWILFLDDDNELDNRYIENAVKIMGSSPSIGAFGGILELPHYLVPPSWVIPMLSYLAIRNYGNIRIERFSTKWGPWEAPGAGAFVHRTVLKEFQARVAKNSTLVRLGRTGTNLASCEDSLLMRCASFVGKTNAYEPSLRLTHHLDQSRFQYDYLEKLMRGYARSHILLYMYFDPGSVLNHVKHLRREKKKVRNKYKLVLSGLIPQYRRQRLRHAYANTFLQEAAHNLNGTLMSDNSNFNLDVSIYRPKICIVTPCLSVCPKTS